jgi:hypothetical protein
MSKKNGGTKYLSSLWVQQFSFIQNYINLDEQNDRLCGLVVRVLGYRSRVRFPTLPEKKRVVGLERGPLSLVSTTEELLDRKLAAPV